MTTHIKKAEPVRAWQHVEGAPAPDWAFEGGVHEDDLAEREIEGVTFRPIPVGHWLVEYRGGVMVIDPEQFEADFEAVQ